MSANQFCSKCVDLNEIPGTPSGKEEQVAGVTTYVAQGSGKGSVVYATDIFGLGISNNKLVADEIAKQSGATVYVPDLFNGDPISPKDFQLKKHTDDSDPQPLEEAFKNFGAWLDKGHKPDSSDPIFKKVLAEVGRKGPVVTSGACYGGRLSANAAQQPNGIVKGAIMNHPALLEKGEADKVQVPVLLNMSETDVIFTDEIKQDWLDVLKKKNLLDSGSKTYKGAVHGHTCRPDLTKPEIKAAYEQSLQASAEFIKKIFA